MSFPIRRVLAVALCLIASSTSAAWAARPKPTGFDPARASALSALPVRVVLLNDTLRSQWAYGSYSVTGDIVGQTVINNTVNNMISSGMPAGAAIGAGALGGALAGAIIDAQMRAQALSQVERADGLIAQRKCRIDVGSGLVKAVDRAVGSTPWGAASVLRHDRLDEGQKLDKLVADTPERMQVLITYSMTPDYSNLVSTLNVASYASALKAEGARKGEPAWLDDLVIASDPMPLAAKTSADIEAATKAEDERYRTSGIAELVKAANGGDDAARKQAVTLMSNHRQYLREARKADWTPGEAAMQRAIAWSANDCAMLRTVAAQHAQEAESMLSRLFQGQLPARSEAGARIPSPLEGTERVVESRGVGMYVMGRGGDTPTMSYRYSWMPAPSK